MMLAYDLPYGLRHGAKMSLNEETAVLAVKDRDGSTVRTVPVRLGMSPMMIPLAPGETLVSEDKVVLFDRRGLGGDVVSPAAFESSANPDFRPTRMTGEQKAMMDAVGRLTRRVQDAERRADQAARASASKSAGIDPDPVEVDPDPDPVPGDDPEDQAAE